MALNGEENFCPSESYWLYPRPFVFTPGEGDGRVSGPGASCEERLREGTTEHYNSLEMSSEPRTSSQGIEE